MTTAACWPWKIRWKNSEGRSILFANRSAKDSGVNRRFAASLAKSPKVTSRIRALLDCNHVATTLRRNERNEEQEQEGQKQANSSLYREFVFACWVWRLNWR